VVLLIFNVTTLPFRYYVAMRASSCQYNLKRTKLPSSVKTTEVSVSGETYRQE